MKTFLLTTVLFTLIGFSLSCVSSGAGGRQPASEEKPVTEDQKQKLADTIKKVIERFEKTQGQIQFKVLRLPVRSVNEIENGNKYVELAEDLAADLEEAYNVLGEMEPPEEQAFILEYLSPSDRHRLLDACMFNDVRVGKEIHPLAMTFYSLCRSGDGFTLVTPAELGEALRSFPAQPRGVKYNGSEADMKYTDLNLKSKVNVITHFLMNDKVGFREVFFNLPDQVKGKFLFNTYLSGEASKVEPFDLILHNFTVLFNSIQFGEFREVRQPINFIELKRIVKKALAQAFLVSNKKDIYAWESPSLSVIKDKEDFVALCANGIYKSSYEFHGGEYRVSEDGSTITHTAMFGNWGFQNSILEKWTLSDTLYELLDNGVVRLDYRCGSEFYDIQLERQEIEPIPRPKPLVFQKEINAVMTIALTQEIGPGERKQIRKYLQYLEGWDVEGEYKLVETKKKFEDLFQMMDVYIPISHSMDVNYFMVGTERANYLKLSRVYENAGKPVKAYLHLLLPASGDTYTNSLTYNVLGLGDLYDQRRQQGKGSLFLMNLSCGSAGTLATWTQVYRNSVEAALKREPHRSLADFQDLPYIIGADRYFSTSSLADLAAHVNYPLETIRMLAQGQSVRDVLDFLEKPDANDFIDKMVGFLKGFKGDSARNGFGPVFNLDKAGLLTYGGYKMIIENKHSGRRQTY